MQHPKFTNCEQITFDVAIFSANEKAANDSE